jgi:hypothetical protein
LNFGLPTGNTATTAIGRPAGARVKSDQSEPTGAKTTAIMIPREEISGEKTDAGIEARLS